MDSEGFELPLRQDAVLAFRQVGQQPFPFDPSPSPLPDLFRPTFGMHCMHKVNRLWFRPVRVTDDGSKAARWDRC